MTSDEPAWKAAARARLDEARKKNGRIGARKSREGCVTCKLRRVKCDETRPNCHRCVSSGRPCGGYHSPASSPPTPDHESRLAEVMKPLAQSSTLRNDFERRAFDFYMTVSAPHINGSQDRDFWFGHVLRLAHVEPVVMDSLLAISILYEHPQYVRSFRADSAAQKRAASLPTSPTETLDPHHATALTLYNRALRSFQHQMDCGQATPQLAMVTCILFVCIEMIRDHVPAAMILITKGAAIISQSSDLKLSALAKTHFDSVVNTFTRLTELAGTFGCHLPKPALPQPAVPTFRSVAEARTALRLLVPDSQTLLKETAALASTVPAMQAMFEDEIWGPKLSPRRKGKELVGATMNGFGMAATFSHLEYYPPSDQADHEDDPTNKLGEGIAVDQIPTEHPQAASASSTSTSERMTRLQELDDCQRQLEHRFAAWHQAFKALPPVTEQAEIEIVCSAMMHFHISSILLLTRTATDQTVFDQHTPHFAAVLDHAHALLESRGGGRLQQPPAFTLDVALLPSLYIVATLCRVPSLRRRALRLMTRAPRKEGVFGATSTAEFSACLIALEEQGLGLPPPDWDGTPSSLSPSPSSSSLEVEVEDISDAVLPPEHRRVAGWGMFKSTSTGAHEVRALRFRDVGGERRKDAVNFEIQEPARMLVELGDGGG